MKTTTRSRFSSPRQGSAVLVILVLLACMAALLAANSAALHALKTELRFIDAHQQQKYRGGGR